MDESQGGKRGGRGDEDGGTLIKAGCRRPAQVTAIRPHQFTREKRQAFLNTLAATCNVTTAARAAGISKTTAHRLRRESPEFARLWEDALDMGYRHLEEQLLARAIEGVDALATDPDPDAADVSPLPPLLPPSPPLDERCGAAAAMPGGRPARAGGTAGGIGLAAGAGAAGIQAARGLPVAYQLALLILNQRRAAVQNGPRNHRRKALSTREVDALLVEKLDRLDRQEAARAARAGRASDAGSGKDGPDGAGSGNAA